VFAFKKTICEFYRVAKKPPESHRINRSKTWQIPPEKVYNFFSKSQCQSISNHTN